jgi:hypothetical protein
MSFPELMRFLLENDIQVSTDGQSLRYDAPDGVVTEQVLGELRRHKQGLISWLTAGGERGDPPVTRTLPTYIQEEYWHRVRAHPRPTVYTIARRLRFAGEVDVAALRTALDGLVARHATLRTRFSSYQDGDADQPVLEVLARLPVRLVVTDLTGLPDERRAAELKRLCAEQAAEPFTLDRAPLWRAQLFACGTDGHVLLWTLQHIICDGWSMSMLFDQLVQAYAAERNNCLAGTGGEVAGAGLSYPDYARWQRRHLSGTRRDRLVAFWRAQLAGASLALALPAGRPPPPHLSGSGRVHHFALPADAFARLRVAARELGSTVYLLVFSAFARLLSELTGADDLVIPISHANRSRAEQEAVVGLLSDRVPVRIRLGGVANPGELVRRVGDAVFAALDQALPLSLLVAALPESQRPAGFYPTVLFTLLDEPDERWDLGDLLVTTQPDSVDGAARMRLYCFMTISGDRLSGAFEYASELFDPATVAAWSARFVALLTETGCPR